MNLDLFEKWANDAKPARRRVKIKKPGVVTRPLHPNAGITVEYARSLRKMIDMMHKSVMFWIARAYRAEPPKMAMDASSTASFIAALRKMFSRWTTRINEAAPRLADYFSQSVHKRSKAQLTKILKQSGMTVQFEMTPAMREILGATVQANVSLIKSIPTKYLAEVEGAVMRAVQTGNSLKTLTDDIQKIYHKDRKRAAFIARDQSSKATAAFTRARQIEAGIKEAVWLHGGAGKHPRPTHLAAGKAKVRYKVDEGWFDPDAEGEGKGRHIFPGELINCRCVSKSVVPGFS